MREIFLHKSGILGSKLIVRSVQLAGIFLKVLSDKIGPFLRRVSLFLPPPFANCGVFAKVDLPLPFEPRSQALLAVVSLLSAFHHSRFGPVLRRLKRFFLPPFANCGVFAKVCILCWVAEHYNTFCMWRHRPQRLHTTFVCKYQPILHSKYLVAAIPCKYWHR